MKIMFFLFASVNYYQYLCTVNTKTTVMARPRIEGTNYKVSIHKNGGYMYASTQPLLVDKETGRTYNKRVHWGTVDSDNKFHPGKAYIYADVSERDKLVFPSDWDMSEAEALKSNRGAGRPASNDTDDNRLYGDVWLLDKVADVTGVKEDLLKTFDGNKDMVDDVLTIAYYLYITGNSVNRLSRWQRIERAPSVRELTSPVVTYLTQHITEAHRMSFLKRRASRVGRDELCAVDSTSRSAYGSALADIRWGKNKDRLPLPQTVEMVVYTLSRHMPIYYRTYPGNIPDSRSVETMLKDLDDAGFPRVILITDRGYESIQNLERFILRGQPMIMCVKTGQKMVLDKIEAFGDFAGRPDGMEIDPGTRTYYKQYDIDYEVEGRGGKTVKADRLRLNLYFDAAQRAQQLTDLDIGIKMQREALRKIMDGKEKLDDEKTVRRNYNYFTVERNEDDTIKSFSIDENKVARARRTSGFHALVTLMVDIDPMQASASYSLRDEQEKYYRQMKSTQRCNRQGNWSEDGKTGRLFILFVSMILSSYVKYVWKSTQLKNMFSSSIEILDEMRSIRCIEHRGKAKFVTPFVGKQINIAQEFNFKIPEGCDKKYKSKKVKTKKVGRPRKSKTVELES